MEDKISDLLFIGEYKSIEPMIKDCTYEEIINIFMNIGLKNNNIGIIIFLFYIYYKTKEERWIKMCAFLIDVVFCSFEGGYGAAKFLYKELLEHEENLENLVNYYNYSRVPETQESYTDEEVKKLASKILKIDKDNPTVLDELNRRGIHL